RPESDRETSQITEGRVRLPVRSDRACRPARQAGPPNVPCAPPSLLLSCSRVLVFSCSPVMALVNELKLWLRHHRPEQIGESLRRRARAARGIAQRVLGDAPLDGRRRPAERVPEYAVDRL